MQDVSAHSGPFSGAICQSAVMSYRKHGQRFMDLSIIIPSAVGIIAVGLYVVALWIGDHRTISTLAWTANAILAGLMAMVALSWSLGVQLSFQLILNPSNWITAVGKAIREI